MPAHSQTSSLRSRVMPAVSWTTAARVAVSRLTSVDLPTLGKPTIATVPSRSSGLGARGCVSLVGHGGGASPRPALRVHVGEPVEEHAEPSLDLRRSPPCSPRRLAEGPRAERLAERDRARREVAELPELRAVDRRPARPGTCSWIATIAAPGCASPGSPAPAASLRRRRRARRPRATVWRISRTASRSDSPRRTEIVPCRG